MSSHPRTTNNRNNNPLIHVTNKLTSRDYHRCVLLWRSPSRTNNNVIRGTERLQRTKDH